MNSFLLERDGSGKIPITIVSGPSGAGKTTLLRNLLQYNDGRRVAVLLDHPAALHFTDLPVDRFDGNSVLFNNGSTCVGLDGDIGTALASIHSRMPTPDHLVVEAPAHVNPLRVGGYAYLPGLRRGSIVVVISAEDLLRTDCDGGWSTGLSSQLRHAEILVVNKMDLLDAQTRVTLRHSLARLSIKARVIESEYCLIPPSMLLGAPLPYTPAHAIHAEWTKTFTVGIDRHKERRRQPHHENDYRAWLLSTDDPIDGPSFRDWANALPDSILRGDGLLRLRGEQCHRFRFQLCGSRWSLERDEPVGGVETTSWVSLVGVPAGMPPGHKGAA